MWVCGVWYMVFASPHILQCNCYILSLTTQHTLWIFCATQFFIPLNPLNALLQHILYKSFDFVPLGIAWASIITQFLSTSLLRDIYYYLSNTCTYTHTPNKRAGKKCRRRDEKKRTTNIEYTIQTKLHTYLGSKIRTILAAIRSLALLLEFICFTIRFCTRKNVHF